MSEKNKEKNPLAFLPSAVVVRERLEKVLREAERLKILLTTAEQIEAVESGRRNDPSH